MKAATYHRYGPPDVVTVTERATPKPGPRDVLIRIHASTVSTADWRARSLAMPAGFGPMARPVFGFFGPRQPILGTELSGEVVATGASVTRFRPGDAVFAFTGARYGCHAEYRVIREDGLIHAKPANLTHEQAAALCFGGTTALHFLQHVKAGEHILITGASGCVGSAAVQLARHRGATVTGLTSTRNLALVRDLGAHHVIDYTVQDLSTLTQTYDVILDTNGTAPYGRIRHLLRPQGRLLTAMGTFAALMGFGGPTRASTHRAIAGVVKVTPDALHQLADLAQRGIYRPLIDRSYPLDQVAAAHAHVDTGHKRGSVVLSLM